MKITVFIDLNNKILALDKNQIKNEPNVKEIEVTLSVEIDFDVFYQNYKFFSVNSFNNIYRHDYNECLDLKTRYIERIRRFRKKAFYYYDIYDKDCLKGKRERSQSVEDWYLQLCNLPESYNNNIPYQDQIPTVPLELKQYTIKK